MKPASLARWFSALGLSRASAWHALLMAGAASAADVHVMISAGFHGAYSELAPVFERASGHHLVTTRGPSMGDFPESIPTRLARGEAADLVILDDGAADELGRRGLVRADSKVRLARSLIGMVVQDGGVQSPTSAASMHSGTRCLRQNRSPIRTAAAAPICRPRYSRSSASPTRSQARAGKCEDRHPASRWPRWWRVARRKSASSRSAS